MNFIRFFTRRPVSTIMVFLILLMFGVYSYTKLAKDLFPKIDVPYVTIATIYGGAGPEEIESQVTEKIEEAVASVSGLDSQLSVSQESLSLVVAQFELAVDPDVAENDVRSKVEQIVNDLPDDANRPITAKFELGALPIAQIAVLAPHPVEDIYQLVDESMIDRFTQINGLASVDVFGQKEREIVIEVSSKKLVSYGLSILDLNSLIAAFNMKLPAGRIINNEQELNLRLKGDFSSLEAIEQLEIPTSAGSVRLADIARVEDTFEEVRNVARLNGQSAVGLSLIKASDANTVEIMAQVRQLLNTLEREIPDEYDLVLAKDTSKIIHNSLNNVLQNLGLGILLTGGILLLFLHQPRLTLIATVSMPLAVIASFSLMYASGFSANAFALMALALSVGVLVANVIVVLENIQRHLQETKESPLNVAENGTNEVMVAVFGSALTNMAVFLPIAMTSGMVGKMFREFGLTVIYATCFSLFLSFSLTPMLASRMLKHQEHHKGFWAWFGKYWESLYGGCEHLYHASLSIVFRWRWATLLLILALFLSSLGLLAWIEKEFMTETDEAEVTISVEKAVDESVEGTLSTLMLIEQRLKPLPYVKHFFTQLGGTTLNPAGVNEATVTVSLVDKEQRELSAGQIAAAWRHLFADIPGATLSIESTSSVLSSNEKPISLYVMGQDMETLFSLSERIVTIFKQIPGTDAVDINWRTGKPEIQVTPDNQRCTDYGITPAEVAMMFRISFAGDTESTLQVQGEEYDIYVKLADADRTDLESVSSLPIQTPKGIVRLEALADVKVAEGPSRIYRYKRQRAITVGANVSAGYTIGAISEAINQQINALSLPAGITFEWGGDVEKMGDSFGDMGVALVMAVALTYMVLSILLESAIHSVTIMSTVPLSLIGVLS
ncbi:MAG: efflux RND transporter permease subunit, partial [Candidatus Vecturithrix sp.]|nr:efflux RND transporter permease subunit [Candidatus Vecturithrix sp.]